jgi:hypothetical protein
MSRVHDKDRADLIKQYLSEFATELVLFDEVQHLQAVVRRDRMVLLDFMKWVSTAGKASVVMSAAMSDGRRLIDHDAQLLTRFAEIAIPRFKVGVTFGCTLILPIYARAPPTCRTFFSGWLIIILFNLERWLYGDSLLL